MAIIPVPNALIQVEEGTADRDTFLAALNGVECIGREARALKDRWEKAAIAWINEHGEVECGDVRWYVGQETARYVTDPKALMEDILTETGGDLGSLVACLSSQPFKPGACRTVLGNRMDRHFKTETKPDLKTGKPLKRLKKTLARKDTDGLHAGSVQ